MFKKRILVLLFFATLITFSSTVATADSTSEYNSYNTARSDPATPSATPSPSLLTDSDEAAGIDEGISVMFWVAGATCISAVLLLVLIYFNAKPILSKRMMHA